MKQRPEAVEPPMISKCFPAGTLVVTPSGPRPIDDLQVGNPVVSIDFETGIRIPVPILRIDCDVEEVLLRITFSDGDGTTTTPTQRLRSTGEWILSGNLGVRSKIENHIVSSVDKISWRGPVYTLVVEAHNNYIVLTRRKSEIVCHDNSSDLGEKSLRAPQLAALR